MEHETQAYDNKQRKTLGSSGASSLEPSMPLSAEGGSSETTDCSAPNVTMDIASVAHLANEVAEFMGSGAYRRFRAFASGGKFQIAECSMGGGTRLSFDRVNRQLWTNHYGDGKHFRIYLDPDLFEL